MKKTPVNDSLRKRIEEKEHLAKEAATAKGVAAAATKPTTIVGGSTQKKTKEPMTLLRKGRVLLLMPRLTPC